MKKILISACLIGEVTRYDGASVPVNDPLIHQWLQERRLIPICPETAGGLSIPRPPAEILGGTGIDVLAGRARVVDCHGNNVTHAFVQGAEKAVALAQKHAVTLAILKQTSPSCGSKRHYDGSFTRTSINGQGVCAALLVKNGILVFSEKETQVVENLLGNA